MLRSEVSVSKTAKGKSVCVHVKLANIWTAKCVCVDIFLDIFGVSPFFPGDASWKSCPAHNDSDIY